ncbi:hypothetical protein [Methylobacterium brachiatum]|uniref:DUF4935 domain-containing protein n=2 Tax=Methylorubrum extorquens TaxID=408 RepID=B7L3A5_METC4|nr:hypothetical protein [Methylobacterium brachiatum]ACK86313.1 hypothetical protein Mchl_5577 [Methylorubrum extorquens CM4]
MSGDTGRSRPRILVSDATPLSLLGMIDALDWLFVPGCDVWLTDMVMEEVVRPPPAGGDLRRAARGAIKDWMERNRDRITRVETDEGRRYAREMELWRRAGEPPDMMPNWADRGEASLLSMVRSTKDSLSPDEAIIALVDERDARDVMRGVRGNIDMMGTQTFVRWMLEDFGILEAEHAWTAIMIASGGKADPGEEEDPVHIRKGP